MLSRRSLVLSAALLSSLALGVKCPGPPVADALIQQPPEDALLLAGELRVKLLLPAQAADGSFAVHLDGADVSAQLERTGAWVQGDLSVPAGWHELVATVPLAGGGASQDSVRFEAVELESPTECEVLNAVHCLYPYPSSHFLKPDATKPSGLRIEFPDFALQFPGLIGVPPTAKQFLALDGFSPTASLQMHFPGGVDLLGSGVARLLPPSLGNPTPPPYVGIRMTNERSLDEDSPTVLIRVKTGERVLHWAELDSRAAGNPARQALILRPAQSLVPGERYVVGVRGLVHPGGEAIEAEPAFAALRDRRPSNVPGLLEKQKHFDEKVFPVLSDAGVARAGLILAWDFQTQSEEGLTHHALDMRDMAFDWLDAKVAADEQSFSVESVENLSSCDDGQGVWRIVRGTYQVPLFLTEDPEADANSVGFLNVDANDDPVQNGVTDPVFTISIPCAAIQPDPPVVHPVLLGHGLFGEGDGMVTGLAAGLGLDIDVIAGATNWRGLSSPDLGFVITEVIGVGALGGNKFEQFPALPDRLKQGQINTLLLARMMKRGVFNRDPAFQTPGGVGVFPGEDTEMFYYGISLGGIMGTWFAALTPDLERLNVDVPAMNFGMLLQRSTQFGQFEALLNGIGLTDPLHTLLTLSLNHEVWVRSEPAGYVRHITSDPLPGTNPKKMLVTVAWLDKQVSNQATEIMVRSMGIPNLTSSVQQGFPGIPDVDHPVDSGMVVYDTGSYDIFLPAHYQTLGSGPLIPPLANRIPSSKCDPHAQRLLIPASLDQLATFLQPGGRIENFCDGVCDAGIPYERPGGAAASCDPLD